MHSSNKTIQGPFTPKITVVGVGGAGGNAVNNMIASHLDGVNFLVCNTDAQALENSLSSEKIQLGTDSTGGLGAGARPEIGRTAAEETLDDVMSQLGDQNMVFITAGMGGGTGTGAAPVIAKACKEQGILTVGVVTKPFQFEGAQRMRLAEAGIDELAQYVDTLIVIPNQNLFRIANEKTTFADAFKLADEVLQSGVRGVTDLMVVPGMINLDFADVRSATSEMGKAMMGTGEATGERRAIEAAEQAINNPLLDDVSMKGARSVIINIAGGHDLTLFEIEEASNRITDEVDPNATIIFGSTFDDSLEGSMRVTVVATGIEAEINRRVATRPIRATNTNINTQPQKIETNTDDVVKDSFATRYPEPSRVGQTMAATAPTTTEMAPQTPQVFETPSAPINQQSAVASLNEVAQPTQAAEVTGTIETNFVTDGNAVRKVEAQPQQPQTTAYNNSVIPPHAPAQNETKQESSLTLNPPVMRQVQVEEKKTPSLFERITGRRRDTETEDDQGDTTTSSSSGSTGMPNGLSVERKTVATQYDTPTTQGEQGMLNIEAPKVQAKSNVNADDLEIPAFLRRQIS
jgi:cell division protein FtsZ